MTAEPPRSGGGFRSWRPEDLTAVGLASPGYLHQQLERFDLRLRRGRGQHFLVDRNHLAGILNAAAAAPGDVVLEIGAGLGTMTQALALTGAEVLAVEVDERLAAAARQLLAERQDDVDTRVHIVAADALKVDLPPRLKELTGGGDPAQPQHYKVVANLPYQITGPLTARLLRRLHPQIGFERLVIMVQQEVAERMRARPGSSEYGAFSLLVQFFGEPEIVTGVPAGAFYPQPRVSSSVVRLLPEEPALPDRLKSGFFQLTRAGFNQRRKMLPNAISARLDVKKAAVQEAMEACGLDPRQRAETLSVDDFAALTRRLQDRLPPPQTTGS